MKLSRLLRFILSPFMFYVDDEDGGGARQTDEEIAAAIEERNKSRLAMYDQIADSNDEARAGEFEEIPDDAHTRFQQDDTQIDDDPPHSAEAKKISLKVNGKVVELPIEEVIERAQKIEAADDYLAEAKRIRLEALQSKNPPAKPADESQSVEDDLALVRAIQMGSEEEAVQAIRRLRSPSVKPDDLPRLIDERMSFQSAVNRFQTEYADVFSDPTLRQVILSKDAELVASGDTRSYYDRYKAIGDETREWVKSIRKPDATADKRERKQGMTQVTAAASRVASRTEEETEESAADVIANMARQRGQVR